MAGAVLAITVDSTAASGYVVGDTFALQQGTNVSCVIQVTQLTPIFEIIISAAGSGYTVDPGPLTLVPCPPQPTSGTGLLIGIARVSGAGSGYRNKYYILK